MDVVIWKVLPVDVVVWKVLSVSDVTVEAVLVAVYVSTHVLI